MAIRLPGTGGRLEAITNGVDVRQTESGATTRWQLTGPIQNTQLRVQATFPRALLGPNALFRSADGAGNSGQGNAQPPARQPVQRPVTPAPNVAPGVGSLFSPIFCLVGLVALFLIFGVMRRSMQRRVYSGPPPTMGAPMGMPMDVGFPMPRRRGFWGRRRYYDDYGGGYGGYGVPPIMPPVIVPPVIVTPPVVPDNTYGNPYNPAPQDVAPGGGNDAWGDSGGSYSDPGGGGSWTDPGGGGSWGDSGGGGSWGDSGGGGSWGGGDSGGGGDGGGSDGSISFG